MQRSSRLRSILIFSVFASVPLLVGSGCKKDPPPAVDAAPPPPPPDPVDSAPVDIAPMEEDAGVDAADAAEAGKKGPYVNPNVARLRQCCAQLRAEGKRLGLSPEAGFFTGAAAQCDAMAAQAGPSGTAPELGVLRTALQGRVLPATCARF
ncbi:MAG TPA: hypothetical protein PLR99_21185 [Polyangiaceae bacterium]|jgi:hypothetical protein|nr:hypothetical protein [Polyangiaceae bacterium]